MKFLGYYTLSIVLFIVSCSDIEKPSYSGTKRTFESSYESFDDFKRFYIVPSGDYDSNQGLSTEQVKDGNYAHKAWIVKARAENNDGLIYLPHRAYPTIQLQKTTDGIFRTPCLVSLWVYLDINLIDRSKGSIDDWFSFLTLSPDQSDSWNRTVVVNITPDGYLKLVHVPNQGQQIRIYQADSINDPTKSLQFKLKTWTRLDVYIDFDAKNGYAKVWQNEKLVSQALVSGGNGGLAQIHCGLYASAAIPSGVIYNDNLIIREVENEEEVLVLINSSFQ
ncbi:MAG: hypothetical protein WCG08_12255 [Paludibacter sp.]